MIYDVAVFVRWRRGGVYISQLLLVDLVKDAQCHGYYSQ